MEAKHEDPWNVPTALCERCGAEEESQDIKDGLCPICQAYPDGSFEWHRACYFDGEANSHEEADAFQSGWRRAETEWEKKTADLLAALEVLTKHAQETYPHFESERGQQDIKAALAAISKARGAA